jgi:microcystin degradation protein MlrC
VTNQPHLRVLLAGFFHETHTFISGVTSLQDFTVRRNSEMLSMAGDGSPMGAIVEAAPTLDWHAIPAIDMRATPSATVADEVVETWWNAIQSTLHDNRSLDGIYLVLHGAMVTESLRDVEGEMLWRLRRFVGEELLIGGVTDLHANYSARMADHSNLLVTYRENPHTDAVESALRSAKELNRLMRDGQRARTFFAQPPLMWAPPATGTADEPMRSLETTAREAEGRDGIIAVNVHAGYSFADTPDTGVSFSVCTTGDESAAQAVLNQLVARAHEKNDCTVAKEPTLEEVLPHLRELLAEDGEGPILLVEPSDNIGGGAAGDSTHILRFLLDNEIRNSGVVINDAEAVRKLCSAKVGESLNVAIGGYSSEISGGPVALEAVLVSISDGRFHLEDEHSHLASMHGADIDMGTCAVVESGGVTVLLTSHKTAPFDLGMWRSQGVEPESLSVIGVKAAVGHRRAYDSITRASFTVATPGPCTSRLIDLPFRHIRRPISPLDSL